MIDRRGFLMGVAGVVAESKLWAQETKLRAAIIGHTGKGDYGHGLDMVFHGRANVRVVAVADVNDAGRSRAVERTGAQRSYADWRKMLETERPQLLSIAPRQTSERREMLLAAMGAGTHVVCEKPFVRTPADGDEVLALAERKRLRIAVMHQMRLAPAVVHLTQKIEQGLIGDLLEIRAWGKQDARAGGEDLVVLGVHLFDLMRLFAGEPMWCGARVMEGGREATLADVKLPTEDLGPVLGNEIDAQFSFGKGVFGSFTSRGRLREHSGYWGIELIGSTGAARILADIWPRVLIRRAGKWEDAGQTDQWRPIEDDPATRAAASQRSTAAANARVVDDWLAAITGNRQPLCSGYNGAKAVEMAMAVWHAALSGGRIKWPLSDRGHALSIQERR